MSTGMNLRHSPSGRPRHPPSGIAPPGQAPASVTGLRRPELAWLARAVFAVSAGYGALLPVLPGWLQSVMPLASATEVVRHVGLLSGAYALGVLVGAPLWGFISDRAGRNLILMIGFSGYVASLVALLLPCPVGMVELYVLRGCGGFFVAAIVNTIVAEASAQAQGSRRFAWLGSVSLLGFLVRPASIAAAAWIGSWFDAGVLAAALMADAVVLLTAVLSGAMMIALSRVLHTRGAALRP